MRKSKIIKVDEDLTLNISSMTFPKELSQNDIIMQELKKLSAKVDRLDDSDDLELNYSNSSNDSQEEEYSQMLNISPTQIDSFGDSIELTTKSRLENNHESFQVAFTLAQREYHNMVGNRYGKHSKLIPVLDNFGRPTKLDKLWFSGSDIKIITIKEKEYYKIRLLIYDILVKKLLLSRIPTSNGGARQEEINLAAANNRGNLVNANTVSNIQPQKPIDYGKKQNEQSVGDTIYDN
jgi:hypothetical protein